MPTTSRDDFDALIRRAGLRLSAAEASEIYVGWGYMEPMLDRLRTENRGRDAEPAHIFRPDAFGTEEG